MSTTHSFTSICVCTAVLLACVAAAQANPGIGVVINSGASNPFGVYLPEILKAEGFAGAQSESLGGLTLAQLQAYDTIVLAETSLTAPQATMFRQYVSGGGNLIGMRPDSQLDDVFGIASRPTTLSEGYIKISAATPVGVGLQTAESMKMHGTATCYGVAGGATKLASLYSSSSTDTGYASVIQSSYGSGQAAAFSYDLAKSVVYTRQGNPAWANADRDGDGTQRPPDQFYDTTPGSTHWNDNTKSDILQVDEQMRLLTHSIEAMNASKTPMPRLWYFPDAKKSMLVFTGDQDNGTPSQIQQELTAVNSRGGKASIYLKGPSSTKPTNVQVLAWTAAGNEIGVHVDDTAHRPCPTWAGMYSAFSTQWADFHTRYPTAPPAPATRNHYLMWVGEDSYGNPEFTGQIMIDRLYGIKMNFDSYFKHVWPQYGTSGYTISSGLPMRFAMSTGTILDVFQGDTQIPDEGWGSIYSGGDYPSHLSAYTTMLDASLNQGKYAWIVANFHPVHWATFSTAAIQVLDHAVANDIPIWSGAQMNSFTRMRDSTEFQDVQWNGRALSFVVDVPSSGEGQLTVMVPYSFAGDALEGLSVGGSSTDYSVETIAGVDYALFLVGSGTHSINALYVLIPGDATKDGNVDAADAQRLAEYWGTGTPGEPATWEQGNFDDDYFVGPKDAAILAAHRGYGTGEENGTALPEPSAIVLLLGAMALLSGWRPRL